MYKSTHVINNCYEQIKNSMYTKVFLKGFLGALWTEGKRKLAV